MKKLVVYDLDGTLAESKRAINPDMARVLAMLLDVAKVAVISGADWPQFETQVLNKLPPESKLESLSILPTCGTKFYQFDGQWTNRYSEDMSAEDKKMIVSALNQAVAEAGFKVGETWGETIEDRGSQITYSALGQLAPLEEKEKWDPDFAKRKAIKSILNQTLSQFSVHLGGATSIDVTKPGIDKAYGIHKLRDILGISIDEMIFMGDSIFPGGNDYPAKEAGVFSIKVRDPEETKSVTEAIIGCLEGFR